ncbi:hypothetical protein BUE80_DR006644, partial [Diplocarpon rosae]
IYFTSNQAHSTGVSSQAASVFIPAQLEHPQPTLSNKNPALATSSLFKMPGPHYGALGASWTVSRALQMVCLITIIGMCSNFVNLMVNADQKPADVMVGTISVTTIAALYIIVSYILYWDSLLNFLIPTALDASLLIAVIIVAVTVGKPLSYLDCAALPASGGSSLEFLTSVGKNMSKANYWVWAGATRTTCFEMKAVWGLSIALCILFAFSSVVSMLLWKRNKTVAPQKDVEG